MRAIKTLAAATAALERHAAIEGQLGLLEQIRSDRIAAANAVIDQERQPLDKELAAIAEALEPWWKVNAADHTKGKRKSVELGGCMIGTRSSKDKLSIGVDEGTLLEELQTLRWAKPYVRVTPSIDKAVVLSALTGKHGTALKALGFNIAAGADAFFVKRVAQGGVVGAQA